MKKLFILGVAIASLVACNQAETKVETAQQQTENQEEVVDVKANRMLAMEIDGMVCKMGCGGAIRKELKSTGAVAQCDFDFEEDRATNTATIYFDKDKISSDRLVALVEGINNGQFKVGEVNSERLESEQSIDESNAENNRTSEEPTVEISVPKNVEVPNIFDLLAGLLLG